MTRLPRGAPSGAMPASTATSVRLRRVGWDPSPVSTRPVVVRAPARWSPLPRSCRPARRGEVPGLADSKLLTAKARERCYDHILNRALRGPWWSSSPQECDRLGMHVANVEALRRAVALLDVAPPYVLTDGFPVDGLGRPGLAVWKGDRVAACISAASVVAKVTRDRIMVALDRDHPAYDFKTHKGYVTDVHNAALVAHGPCPEHRMRFVNVRRAAGLEPLVESEIEPSVADLVDSTRVGTGRPRGESA